MWGLGLFGATFFGLVSRGLYREAGEYLVGVNGFGWFHIGLISYTRYQGGQDVDFVAFWRGLGLDDRVVSDVGSVVMPFRVGTY